MKNRKMKNIHIYILLIIFILYIILQFHNYCENNPLRHTFFEIFESMGLYKKDSLCFYKK